MNILIIHAHENPDSFCSALANTATSTFEREGHTVTISDLYKKDFNPIGGKHDFKKTSDASYYKYASEQIHAHQNNLFSDEIREEMELLIKADVLIFNFPLWWFGMPAILKGWVDRVLAYGFAYGGEYGFYKEGRFKNKKALLSITTGSPADFYSKNGAHKRTITDILKNIHQGIFNLIGFDVLPDFVAYGASRISDEDRKKILEDYASYIKKQLL
ncbi:NAD(P)H dehydrogenase (quinone) [Maribacter vaceletii]|uniref:NAD(P)H dehydrogenase (Quinone) n=1 Tax=Maribacter vaceletii TaxID=1206816 RepID=A0A495EEN2_9FLAO|nr:NAD(P)H-dependent oxidoreductase [Maribacter vaceletii]RKR15216.1 NAD(P)H dehydrogenase (quinone) [Maribacter vaceletii]